MIARNNQIKVSTPGRICLFGEHQDYLGLPIIASAISLRIEVTGQRRKDTDVEIDLPDIGEREVFNLNNLKYTKERDYFKSAINVLKRHGFSFASGFGCSVHGEIPVNAGTSSSSALMVSWINFLAQMSDQEEILAPEQIAQYAYEAEVVEFSEPGGMMDHYSTALGGTIWLEFYPAIRFEKLNASFGSFVLGNSGEPKDTKYILARVKHRIINALDKIRKEGFQFDIHGASKDDLQRVRKALSEDEHSLISGTLENREITKRAKEILSKDEIEHQVVGDLLTQHHAILRDALRISTTRIDRMINAALNAGAYGAKINGSGGGGCMFAYAPSNPEEVKEAIIKAGGQAYIVTVDVGTTTEKFLNGN